MKKKIKVILAVSAILAGCMGSGAAAQEETMTFAFANATMNNGFFVTINSTMEALAEADGYEWTMVDCDWDNEKQTQQMEDLVNSGVDFIFLAPADVNGATFGVQAAADAGIPVIVLDNPLSEEDSKNVVSTIASDNYQAGVVCAEMLVEDPPEGGTVAILNHNANNAAADRVNGFKDTIAEHEQFEIVSELAGGGTIEDSISPSEDILQKNPDLDAFFACNELSAMGVLTAVEAADKVDQIKIYSVDASPDGKELLLDGSFAGLAAQSPITIGETAYEFAKQYLNGEEVPESYFTECFEVRAADAEETKGEWQ